MARGQGPAHGGVLAASLLRVCRVLREGCAPRAGGVRTPEGDARQPHSCPWKAHGSSYPGDPAWLIQRAHGPLSLLGTAEMKEMQVLGAGPRGRGWGRDQQLLSVWVQLREKLLIMPTARLLLPPSLPASVSVSVSLSPTVSVSVSISVSSPSLSLCLSLSPSLLVSVSLSLSLPVSVFVSVSISVSVCLYLSLSISLSVSVCFCLSLAWGWPRMAFSSSAASPRHAGGGGDTRL